MSNQELVDLVIDANQAIRRMGIRKVSIALQGDDIILSGQVFMYWQRQFALSSILDRAERLSLHVSVTDNIVVNNSCTR